MPPLLASVRSRRSSSSICRNSASDWLAFHTQRNCKIAALIGHDSFMLSSDVSHSRACLLDVRSFGHQRDRTFFGWRLTAAGCQRVQEAVEKSGYFGKLVNERLRRL